jgi:hypothetical protein
MYYNMHYYMSTVCAAHLQSKKVNCRGTIRSSCKVVSKSTLFSISVAHSLSRGSSRIAVYKQHSMVAVVCINNKVVEFISTSGTTAIKSMQQCDGCEKHEVQSPEVVCNYTKYLGGIDRHDRLQSTFFIR